MGFAYDTWGSSWGTSWANSWGTASPSPSPSPAEVYTKHGDYIYVDPYQKLRQEESQREKVKQAKTDLDRIESVLKETERQKGLAAESKRLAQERKALKRAIELEQKEQEYLAEINRLLMVREQLIKRLRIEEDFLIIMIMARKRLRGVVKPASLGLH